MSINNREVVFILYSLADSNGTERAVVNLANSLVRLNFDVTILSLCKQEESCTFSIDSRVNLESLGGEGGKVSIYANFLKKYSVYVASKSSPVVVSTLVYIGIVVSLLHKTQSFGRLLFWEHVPYELPSFIFRVVAKLVYPSVATVVCLNQEELVKYKGFRADVRVIPNIVDMPIVKKNIARPNGVFKVLYVGRLSEEKGPDLFVEVVNNGKHLFYERGVTFDIVGSGELETQLKDMVSLYGLDNLISFSGRSNNILEKYSESSMLLVTSRFEGFGLVMIEAMSQGLPVVAFDVESGPRCLIDDGSNGFLVKPFDLDLVVRKIILLSGNENTLDVLGANANETALEYSSVNVVVKWERLLSSEGGRV